MLLKIAKDRDKNLQRFKRTMSAYPDYSKSLISQRHLDPEEHGKSRALNASLLGAALGALIARLITKKPRLVLTGAGLGGVLGGAIGYKSGKNEALSHNSKILFLRRRMGINEPGELEAILKYPNLAEAFIENKEDLEKKSFIKKASRYKLITPLTKGIAGGLLGAGAGGYLGYHVTPRLSGYYDIEPARRISGVLDAGTGAALGAALASGAIFRGKMTPAKLKLILGIIGGLGAGELIPVGVATLQRTSNAMNNLAESGRTVSIPYNIKQLMTSNAAKGAIAGAGLAGLAGLVRGLSRPKTDKEIKEDKSRSEMVIKDFLKYLLPLAVGGGVIGSLIKNKNNNSNS